MPPYPRKNKQKQYVSYKDVLTSLSSRLLDENQIEIGSFFEFVRDVWSQGYDHPDHFDTWLPKIMCGDIHQVLQEGKNYAGIYPRGHYKSTILGHAFCVWKALKCDKDSLGLYLSFSDEMAAYHMGEIKKSVRRNPILSKIMVDKAPRAEYSLRYNINGINTEIVHGGLFSFRRGFHTNQYVICDDVLRDPDNPLNMNQMEKITDWFMQSTMYIPNKGAPVIVLGTPMLPGDLLDRLKDDDRFLYRALPVFDPTPDMRILAPEIRDEVWLLQQQKMNPKSFASEFMLTPYLSTDAFFTDEELRKVEDSSLQPLNPHRAHSLTSSFTVAGFDIGKKRHPSHISIFITEPQTGNLIQVYQEFLDGWDYASQVKYLNDLVDNFDIDVGYVDNTRGEVEERGLSTIWKPLHFSAKQKNQMASVFEQYVSTGKIKLIRNERQHSQIISVDNNLNAPDTPMGHGDAFFSNALALLAHYENLGGNTASVGNLNDFIQETYMSSTSKNKINFPNSLRNDSCPTCHESAGWIPANNLCLICHYKKMEDGFPIFYPYA